MQTNAPTLGRITLIYIGIYLGIAVLLNVILFALDRFAGVVIEANAVGWMPLLLGAMMAGQNYGTKAGAKPPQSFAWKAGLLFMLSSVVLSLVVLYAIALVMQLDVAGLVASLRAEAGDDLGLIAGIIGGFLLFIWVLQRFAFSFGAGQGVKQAALRAK